MTTVSEGSTAGGGATLANEENKKLRRQEQNKTRSHGQQKSASAKGTHIAKKGGTRNKEQQTPGGALEKVKVHNFNHAQLLSYEVSPSKKKYGLSTRSG